MFFGTIESYDIRIVGHFIGHLVLYRLEVTLLVASFFDSALRVSLFRESFFHFFTTLARVAPLSYLAEPENTNSVFRF